MERLVSVMLEDLSLYKQCHHCKKVNLAINKMCWNCTFPQLDELSNQTIENIRGLDRMGESIYIANLVPDNFYVSKKGKDDSQLKSYIYNFPRESPLYFTHDELETLALEYKQIPYEDIIKSLQELEAIDTKITIEDVYCSVSLLLLNK